MKNRGQHILLVGGDPCDALDWSRQLGLAGHRVTLLRWSENASFAEASRYCSGSVGLGPIDAGVSAWRARLEGLLQSGRFTHVWPADALAHELLCTPVWQAPSHVRLIGPTANAYALASDRWRAMAIARRSGWSVLPGRHLRQGTSLKSIELASIELPCVARPQRGAAISADESARFSTKFIDDSRALDCKLRDDLPRVGLLLHGAAPGERRNICIAAVLGEVASVSPSPSPGPFEAARLIVAELNWTGLLAVEYRTEAGAMTFVDLRFGLAGWEGADVAAIQSAIRAMVGTADDVARVLPGVDPLPAAARVAQHATRAISKASTSIRAALLCGVTGSGARRPLHPSDSILFVCQGNINRSLVAEQALRRAGFRWVASAALIGMSGRWPSGPAERYVRDVLGMPTDALRSRSLRQGLASLDRIDVVVCFERRQVIDVLRRHPELRGRVHLLTTLAGRDGGPLDIADPHARSDECHRDCFERISRLLRSATSPAAAAPRLAPGSP